MYDPELYRTKEEVEQWKERDPIQSVHRDALRAREQLDADAIERIEAAVAAEIDDAVAFAESGTEEPVADLTRFVTSRSA